jgi:hypothetical protein
MNVQPGIGQLAMVDHLIDDAKLRLIEGDPRAAAVLLFMAAKSIGDAERCAYISDAAGKCLAKANGMAVEIAL